MEHFFTKQSELQTLIFKNMKNKNSDFFSTLFEAAEMLGLSKKHVFVVMKMTELADNDLKRRYIAVLALIFYHINLSGRTLIPVPPSVNDEVYEVLLEVLNKTVSFELPSSVEVFFENIIRMVENGELPVFISEAGFTGNKPQIPDTPFVITGFNGRKFIYTQRLWIHETGLVSVLKDFNGKMNHAADVYGLINDISEGYDGFSLTVEQKNACKLSSGYRLSVITGGPGTGKTTITASLLRLFFKLYPDLAPEQIALTAPTGKAAKRMSESVNSLVKKIKPSSKTGNDDKILKIPGGMTLHRLLGYSASDGIFTRNEKNPLRYRIIIIDESSMLDSELLYAVLNASSEVFHIILLGDAKQLPAVSAGSVFRELTDYGGLNSVSFLTESFRMNVSEAGKGRNIYAVSNKISRQETDLFENPGENKTGDEFIKISKPSELKFEGCEITDYVSEAVDAFYNKHFGFLSDEKFLNGVLDNTYELSEEDTVFTKNLLKQIADFRILTVTNAYLTGKDSVNELFHAKHPHYRRDKKFLQGEPVIVTENNYNYGLFNGDTGVIINFKTENGIQPKAVFESSEGYKILNPYLMSGLELAYAVTVHKSQGSEFSDIFFVLPENGLPLFTNELIYTAVTRAKKSVIIAGKKDVLLKGIEKKSSSKSGIAYMLV